MAWLICEADCLEYSKYRFVDGLYLTAHISSRLLKFGTFSFPGNRSETNK